MEIGISTLKSLAADAVSVNKHHWYLMSFNRFFSLSQQLTRNSKIGTNSQFIDDFTDTNFSIDEVSSDIRVLQIIRIRTKNKFELEAKE